MVGIPPHGPRTAIPGTVLVLRPTQLAPQGKSGKEEPHLATKRRALSCAPVDGARARSHRRRAHLWREEHLERWCYMHYDAAARAQSVGREQPDAARRTPDGPVYHSGRHWHTQRLDGSAPANVSPEPDAARTHTVADAARSHTRSHGWRSRRGHGAHAWQHRLAHLGKQQSVDAHSLRRPRLWSSRCRAP